MTNLEILLNEYTKDLSNDDKEIMFHYIVGRLSFKLDEKTWRHCCELALNYLKTGQIK